jgi:hypothetical protein
MTVTEFAIRSGNHFLASFEPIYYNESLPLSKFDKGLLRSRGIDPESATCRGQVDLVCRAINVRRYHRLAEIPDVIRLTFAGVQNPFSIKKYQLGRFNRSR